MPSGSPHPAPPASNQPRIHPTESSFLFGVVSRFGGRRRLNEPRYKLFWQTMAIAASMLIYGALRSSTMEISDRESARVTVPDSRSAELGWKASASQARQIAPSNTAEARLNRADYFVAKDFTKHINLPAHSTATVEKSDLTHSAQQGRVVQKRVVLD